MRTARWLLLSCVVLAAIAVSAEPAKSAVLIRNDGGGDVLRYVAKYLYLQFRGERVVIDGSCFSSCTLVLGLVAKEQRCFTRKTRFAFHAAWEDYDHTRVTNPLGTAIFWWVYPPEIRDWISRHGGLTSKVLYLEGKELAAMYPSCGRQISSRRD